MKNCSLFLFFIIPIISFSQKDTANTFSAYKNNIKVSPLLILGLFDLEFETAVSKKASLSLDIAYQYPLSSGTNKYQALRISPQFRYYISKVKPGKYNKGFYVLISPIYNFISHLRNIYIVGTSSITKYQYPEEQQTISMSLGSGYQWLLGKRLILNTNIILGPTISNQKRIFDGKSNSSWYKSNNYLFTDFHILLGYRF